MFFVAKRSNVIFFLLLKNTLFIFVFIVCLMFISLGAPELSYFLEHHVYNLMRRTLFYDVIVCRKVSVFRFPSNSDCMFSGEVTGGPLHVPGSETTLIIRGLHPKTRYFFRVKCENALGESQFGAEVAVTTLEERRYRYSTC